MPASEVAMWWSEVSGVAVTSISSLVVLVVSFEMDMWARVLRVSWVELTSGGERWRGGMVGSLVGCERWRMESLVCSNTSWVGSGEAVVI